MQLWMNTIFAFCVYASRASRDVVGIMRSLERENGVEEDVKKAIDRYLGVPDTEKGASFIKYSTSFDSCEDDKFGLDCCQISSAVEVDPELKLDLSDIFDDDGKHQRRGFKGQMWSVKFLLKELVLRIQAEADHMRTTLGWHLSANMMPYLAGILESKSRDGYMKAAAALLVGFAGKDVGNMVPYLETSLTQAYAEDEKETKTISEQNLGKWKEWTILALKEMGTAAKPAMHSLSLALKDPSSDGSIAEKAVDVFVILGTEASEYIPNVAACLTNHRAWPEALEFLKTQGADAKIAVKEVMAKFNADKTPDGRVMTVLGNIGAPAVAAAPRIADVLDEDDSWNSRYATEALAKMAADVHHSKEKSWWELEDLAAIVPKLVPMLKWKNTKAVYAPCTVLYALCRDGGNDGAAADLKKAAPLLASLLMDNAFNSAIGEDMFQWPARVLGVMGDAAAEGLDGLVEALKSERCEVVIYSMFILGKLGPRAKAKVSDILDAVTDSALWEQGNWRNGPHCVEQRNGHILDTTQSKSADKGPIPEWLKPGLHEEHGEKTWFLNEVAATALEKIGATPSEVRRALKASAPKSAAMTYGVLCITLLALVRVF